MKLLISCLICCFSFALKAQKPTTQKITSCGLYSPYQIDVERLIRYKIDSESMPGGDVIGLDLMLGNVTVNEQSRDLFLQIAVNSTKFPLRELNRPLNISLVVDRSASMSENNRMDKLKLALKQFVGILSKDDYLSIVLYDDSPFLLRKSEKVHDKASILAAIDSIQLRGSTNIWAGMLMGYKEIEKNLDTKYTNRLVLFTDGMSTIGVINPKDIVTRSKAYNQKGIETSTFGLGADINFELLQNLATEGHGLTHFIGDCDSLIYEVTTALTDELESMMPVAKDINVTISCPKNMSIVQVYGHALTKQEMSKLKIPIKNIGNGQKRIILARLKMSSAPRLHSLPIDVDLSFYDNRLGQEIKISRSVKALYVKKSKVKLNMLSDYEVRKSFTLAYMAEELKRSLTLFQVKRYKESNTIVKQCIKEVKDNNEFFDQPNFISINNMLISQESFLTQLLRKPNKQK